VVRDERAVDVERDRDRGSAGLARRAIAPRVRDLRAIAAPAGSAGRAIGDSPASATTIIYPVPRTPDLHDLAKAATVATKCVTNN
jgi:hypothetical protein